MASSGTASAEPGRRSGRSVPGEVIVRYRAGTSLAAEASAEVASGARGVRRLPGGAKRLRIGARASVREARRASDIGSPVHPAKSFRVAGP